MSKNIDENLMNLDFRLEDIKNRINLIKKIINHPDKNKVELMHNLKMVQEELTNATIGYIFNEYRRSDKN